MRTFIAIALPQETKDALSGLQAQLKASGADVKWVNPQNIHLTLKFLGEINEEALSKTEDIIREVSGNNAPFRIKLGSVGAFPSLHSPRVIWISIEEGAEETRKIAEELEKRIEKIGIPKEERPFSAHITIGRTRSPLGRQGLIQAIKDTNVKENLGFETGRISLFKSTLSPAGPNYEILKEESLKTN